MSAVWRKSYLTALALAVSASALASETKADILTIAAAASLRGALDEIAELWGDDTAISYASSAALARQIEAGAPFDVFVSANSAWMAYLRDRGAIVDDTIVEIAGNSLVVVTAQDGSAAPAEPWPEMLDTLPADGRIAVGLTQAVPAGIYARQALEAAGRYTSLEARLVQVDNVRLALRLAARGDTAAAIVYISDALADPDVRLLARVPSHTHDPIVYPAARSANSDNPSADNFLAFLTGPSAQAVLRRHGFAGVP